MAADCQSAGPIIRRAHESRGTRSDKESKPGEEEPPKGLAPPPELPPPVPGEGAGAGAGAEPGAAAGAARSRSRVDELEPVPRRFERALRVGCREPRGAARRG